MTAAALLASLTRDPQKAVLFASDPEFRTAAAELDRCWTPAAAAGRLWPIGAAILKPEAALSGALVRGVELLADIGAEPLAAVPIRFTRKSIRQEWRYQINKATPERVAAMDLVLQSAPALYVLFRWRAGPEPAVIAFSELKGPSNPAARTARHLRRRIGGVQDPLVNFIHSPDEPADLVRQWGVLFDARGRTDLLERMAAGPFPGAVSAARALAAQLTAEVSRIPFDLTAALDAAAAACASAPASATRERALDLVGGLRRGERGLWPPLRSALGRMEVSLTAAEVMALATLTPVMHRSGVTATLDGDVAALWAAGADAPPERRKLEEVS
jgi:hypothetical protein